MGKRILAMMDKEPTAGKLRTFQVCFVEHESLFFLGQAVSPGGLNLCGSLGLSLVLTQQLD